MNPIRQLASQTAVYGLSSIFARFINFFFVPIYTRVLTTGNYGSISELFAYIALLQVLLTFGLETGFFRFANKDKSKAKELFSTALTWILLTSILFCILIFSLSGWVGNNMGHPPLYLNYVALILAIDCYTAIFFARLRFENKAWVFALFKSIKILSEVGFNLVLFFVLPGWFKSHPDSFLLRFISPEPDYGYILLAILLSGIVSLLLFIPSMIKTRLRFDPVLWKSLMVYSIPLMIAGLPGIANDYIDRILFRYFSPEHTPWQDQLGIYSAVLKLAVIISLFVQMFRYASEPFFFAIADKDNMKKTYADVMKYFVAFCMFLFLGIALYADLFALILGKDFRGGMDVLPVILMANILLGVTFNLSMWYKLSDRTRYAIYVTMAGLSVTVIIDVVFMPVYGYYAAAWSHLITYVVMIGLSYTLSLRYYPIPYNLRAIFTYFAVGLGLFGLSYLWKGQVAWLRYPFNLLLIIAYLVFVVKYEKIDVRRLKRMILPALKQ